MRYPIITYQSLLEIAKARVARNERLNDLELDLGNAVKWYGEGTEIDTEPFEDLRWSVEGLIDGQDPGQEEELDPDQVEGKAAVELFGAINDAEVPVAALDDPMFWSWVSLASLWNFIIWRQPTAFAQADGSADAWNQYVDGRLSYECVASRMYLRVVALGGSEHAHLASAVPGGTDLWRSHILRVRVGEHPPLVRAIIRLHVDPTTRLPTNSLREFAKELNRTLTNFVPTLLNDKEADALIGEIWNRHV